MSDTSRQKEPAYRTLPERSVRKGKAGGLLIDSARTAAKPPRTGPVDDAGLSPVRTSPQPEFTGTAQNLRRHLVVGRDGRFVIPSDMRDALGIKEGGRVVAEIRDGSLIIDTLEARVRRLQALVRRYDRGSGSVVDEFLAGKRAEAERE